MDIRERLRALVATCGCGACEDAGAEIDRLRHILRVNGLRWGHTHAEIDALIDAARPKPQPSPDDHPPGWVTGETP